MIIDIFARMLLNGGKHGGKQILRAESVREMTRDQLTPEQKAGVREKILPRILRHKRMGLRCCGRHDTRCDLEGSRALRLGRRVRHTRFSSTRIVD